MTEREVNRIVSRLEFVARDMRNHLEWIDDIIPRVRACAGARALESAYDEEKNERNKEAERESSPHTPYKEKGEEKKKERKEVTLAHSSENEAHPMDERVCERLKVSELFAKFWKAYPRKVGKIAAQRAFDKAIHTEKTNAAAEALLEKMCRVLAKQSESLDWKREDGRFIPYPATWLNAGRWEDEDAVAGEVPRRTPEEAAALKARLLAEQEALFGSGGQGTARPTNP